MCLRQNPSQSFRERRNLHRDLESLCVNQLHRYCSIWMDLRGGMREAAMTRGDKCLQATMDAVVACIAHKGRLYRFREGDEFAIIHRNTIASEAAAHTERISKTIEDCKLGGDVSVTASIGVASSRQDVNAKTVINAAEQALHVSKRTTKNCLTCWRVPDDLLTKIRGKRKRTEAR